MIISITKELKFINDTIKFIDELKLRYPNKNTMKSHLNSIVAIIGRIKEMNDKCQLLAPINKYNLQLPARDIHVTYFL